MAVAAVMNEDPTADVVVISRKLKSTLYGAQYLHAPIPGYSPDECVSVHYKMNGTTDDYRRKVYGPMWDGLVSPEDLAQFHYAWDIRETYDRLWEDFSGLVEDTTLDRAGVRWLVDGDTKWGRFDVIFSSIPEPDICTQGHQFKSVTIRAAGDAPELGISIPYRNVAENTVMCNGEDHPSYYRLSRIFGHRTVEWPEWVDPPIHHVNVKKPLSNNCNCWAPIMRVGRYGKWEKGVLTHHAYEEVGKFVASRV
jgi:hypothetical protein